jgi:hypothetical protein
MNYLIAVSFPVAAILLAILASLGGAALTLSSFAMCYIIAVYIFTTDE